MVLWWWIVDAWTNKRMKDRITTSADCRGITIICILDFNENNHIANKQINKFKIHANNNVFIYCYFLDVQSANE